MLQILFVGEITKPAEVSMVVWSGDFRVHFERRRGEAILLLLEVV
jgi:hypothetical protein